jgi:hypothetical protein
VLESLRIDADLGWRAQGIVDAYLLDEAPIAGASLVGRDDAVERDLLAANACESNGD